MNHTKMSKKFDFLKNPVKIQEAEKIEKSYWNYYFNCDDWSTEDIEYKLRMTFNFKENKVLTDSEFTKVIDIIQNNY